MHIYEEGLVDEYDVVAEYDCLGLQFFMRQIFPNNMGTVNSNSLFVPYSIYGTIDGEKTTINPSSFDLLFVFNVLLGFPYYFVNTKSIDIGAGPSLNYLTINMGTSSRTSTGMYGGAGIVLDGAIHLGDSAMINFGSFLTYNFIQLTITTNRYGSSSSFGFVHNIMFEPYIGIGTTIK